LKGKIQGCLLTVLEYLIKAKYVKLEHYFVDGTKIEANANRYSFVWKKSTINNRKKLEEKVTELFKRIDEINEAEEEEYSDKIWRNWGKTVKLIQRNCKSWQID